MLKRGFVLVALCAFTATAERVPLPCGVCSHLAGEEYATIDEVCDMIALTGIGYVRADFNWNHCQKKPGGLAGDRPRGRDVNKG